MNTHLVRLAAGVIVAAGVVGCQRKVDRASSHPAQIVAIPADNFAVQWIAPLQLDSGDALTSLYLRGDEVLACSRENRVNAIGSAGGHIRWAAEIAPPNNRVGAPLLMKDMTIFPTSTSLAIFKNGKRERVIELRNAIRSAPSGENNIVYIGLDYPRGGRLAKLDITKTYGNTVWEMHTSGGMSSAPVLFSQVVYAASENGYVYAVSDERLPVWSLANSAFKTDGRIVADIKVDEFGVYVASTDSKLYCLDRNSGKIKWIYFGGGPLRTAPVVTADSVYQAIQGTGLAAIDKTTGDYNRKPRWLVRGAAQYLSEDAQNVYLRSTDNQIMAVDKKTGLNKFHSNRKDLSLFATNTSGDGVIYAATEDGDVYAIRPILQAGTTGELVLAD